MRRARHAGDRTTRRRHAEREDGYAVLVTMARSMRTAARHAASGMPWETSEQRDSVTAGSEAAWLAAIRTVRQQQEYQQLAKFPESMQCDELDSKWAASRHGGCQELPVMASLPRSRTGTLLIISSCMLEEVHAKRRRNDDDPSYTGRRIPCRNMGQAVRTPLRRKPRVLLGKGRSDRLTAAPCAIRHDEAGRLGLCRTYRRTPRSDARSPRRCVAHRSHRTSYRRHTRSFLSSPHHSAMGISHGTTYRPFLLHYIICKTSTGTDALPTLLTHIVSTCRVTM